MKKTHWSALILTVTATVAFVGLLHAGTLARITGYGDLQFGTTRKVAETANPKLKWECKDPEGGAQVCSAQDPGITDMDQLVLVYVGGLLGKIIMTTRTVNSNLKLLSAWDKYKSIFTKKYGAPSSMSEMMLSPYDDTRAEFLQYGISAINAGRCLYAAVWEDGIAPNSPSVSLSLKPGWVQIAYESTMFQDWAGKMSNKDAEKF